MENITLIELLNRIANGEKIIYSFKNIASVHSELTITDALIELLSGNYDLYEDDISWLNEKVEILDSFKKESKDE